MRNPGYLCYVYFPDLHKEFAGAGALRKHHGVSHMSLLANLKLRKKLLVALAPLVVMVVVAGLYSSIEAKRIDTWYSLLIDN